MILESEVSFNYYPMAIAVSKFRGHHDIAHFSRGFPCILFYRSEVGKAVFHKYCSGTKGVDGCAISRGTCD